MPLLKGIRYIYIGIINIPTFLHFAAFELTEGCFLLSTGKLDNKVKQVKEIK